LEGRALFGDEVPEIQSRGSPEFPKNSSPSQAETTVFRYRERLRLVPALLRRVACNPNGGIMFTVKDLPKHLRPRREKVFGLARGFPHDRNARVRIETYVLAWNAQHKDQGQHQGPITAAYQRVLKALLWHFTNYQTGLCFPSYETIAVKAKCCRDTVYEAILALEQTGVFSWVQRIDRVAERVKDLFGHWVNTYRIVRRSNVYQFRDPLPCAEALNSLRKSSKSENPARHEIQDLPSSTAPPKIIVLDPANHLDAALIRFGRATGALA
jgi:hypothetical protein